VLLIAWAGTSSAEPRRDSQDQAALLLYHSGREAFLAGHHEEAVRDLKKAYVLAPNQFVQFYLALEKTGSCAEAKPHLEALVGQLKDDLEAERRHALAACQLQDLENMVSAGECDAANRILDGLPRPIPEDLLEKRDRLNGACEVDKAAALRTAGRCLESLRLLESLTRPLVSTLGQRKEELISACKTELVGFPPDTTDRSAAFLLVLDAVRWLSEGRVSDALGRLEKARAICDEPAIRLHLARAHFENFDCPRVQVDLKDHAGLESPLALEAERIRAWCEVFYLPPGAETGATSRLDLMGSYRMATLGARTDLDILSCCTVRFE
jgi:tetratricopeptide (TPR) repeat protein